MRSIYFDYNSTTPLDAQVREAMLPFLGETFGNPSSVHHVGRRARVALDEARERVARVWGCKPSEVLFTSGGTESNNLAIFGAARARRERGRHLITSRVEHHSVLRCFEELAAHEGFEVTWLPVDSQGRVDPGDLQRALRDDTILVSIMAANNEVGTLQPVAELGALCRAKGVVFHTDAAQWFGKEPFTSIHDFHADLVSCCAHKFHGPRGSGALFVRSGLRLRPILVGGGQEQERRAGTENLAAIVGFAEAVERFLTPPVFARQQLDPLCRQIADLSRSLPGVTVHSDLDHGLANTVALSVHGADSLSVLAALDLEGVCASGGSACSTGSLEPSHVLLAMGGTREAASSLVRFSLGRDSTQAEVDHLKSILPRVVEQVCEQ